MVGNLGPWDQMMKWSEGKKGGGDKQEGRGRWVHKALKS